ncbi:MAG: helix-turn-helix domain-containing protein [Patescibacteria group bacterium]|jgi:hypothetical protein
MKQEQALDILKMGHNAYLTGPAGSGKTFLLNQYIDYLKKQGVAVGVTASTGIAATHLGGLTIHSWAGFGIKDSLSDAEIRQLGKKRYLGERLKTTSVLIIDEVSMLHAWQLDLVDRICRVFREKLDLPFGGLQVILCGDFFQLPPVSQGGARASFVNHSDIWPAMDLKICYLHEQHRHRDDRLTQILNEIRGNQVAPETLAHLKARFLPPVEGADEVTKLYTHNFDVDAINDRKLQSLPGKTYRYQMRGAGNKKLAETLKKNCLAPETLLLKPGAVVMFVKNNFDVGYVNGTLGRVVDFDENNFPIVETLAGNRIAAAPQSWLIEEDGDRVAEIVQIPLRLAWAITVHKSQGMSLDAAEIDLGKSFERGMGYVALSRVRTLAGIRLRGLNEMALLVNEEILEWDQELRTLSDQATAEFDGLDMAEKHQRQKSFIDSVAVPGGGRPKREKRQKKNPGETYRQTKALILEKLSIDEMAARRGMTRGTIITHLEKLIARGEDLDLKHLRSEVTRLAEIKLAFEQIDGSALGPVKGILGDDFSYEELRLARLFLR